MLGDDVQGQAGYNWCIGVGIATMANALFNCFIICKCVPARCPAAARARIRSPAPPAARAPD